VSTLPERYRRFAEAASPLQARIAVALAGSDAATRAIGAMPARSRQPARVLAALHDLVLAGRAPQTAAADGEVAVQVLLDRSDEVAAVAGRRIVRADETCRGAVLHPAVAEAAHRLGADAVGLVDVGCGAGLNLILDRVGITYDDGRVVGDPSSPVRLSATVVGESRPPGRDVPQVVARVGVDREPLDGTDPDDARWLRACLPPDEPARAARLGGELALLASDPPVLMRGDVVDLIPEAVARVPAGALPVVTTTWALSRLSTGDRRRFLHRITEVAASRPVAWVSVEGVGVAPSVPTLGDRPASGHSLIGLALPGRPAEVLGRCWSRGRLLSWLA
jgi:hypothetical protein